MPNSSEFFLHIGKTEASDARGCIVAKLLAQMLVKSGFNQIITLDLHQAELQGYFDCPVDNLRASPFLFQYIVESVSWFSSNSSFPTLHIMLWMDMVKLATLSFDILIVYFSSFHPDSGLQKRSHSGKESHGG